MPLERPLATAPSSTDPEATAERGAEKSRRTMIAVVKRISLGYTLNIKVFYNNDGLGLGHDSRFFSISSSAISIFA